MHTALLRPPAPCDSAVSNAKKGERRTIVRTGSAELYVARQSLKAQARPRVLRSLVEQYPTVERRAYSPHVVLDQVTKL